METSMAINNRPHADELWAGIGGHFDSLGQIVNEFIDNSISNFSGNSTMTRNIIISLEETAQNGDVTITVEDSGTGIRKLNEAFTLGSCAAAESPLNEHGFGLKHALASANPKNDSWVIYTRTQEDMDAGQFKKIQAPYKIEDFTAMICKNEKWPGKLNGTGTIIRFICKKEMYKTIAKGMRGGITNFRSIADVLCEDIGFIYSGVIEENRASITLDIADANGDHANRSVGAVKPDWEDYIKPGSGSQEVDLGNGKVTIEYQFGKINKKQDRKEFDNTTARRYYQKSMSTSGVEIRINGLVYDGIKPGKGILLAASHPDSVKELISIVNTMCDANGNKYNFETKTWEDVGIVIQK